MTYAQRQSTLTMLSGSWWALALRGLAAIIFGLLALLLPGTTLLNLILGDAVTVVFGLLLAVLPGVGLLSLLWLVGLWALIIGILLIILAFRVRGMRGETERRLV